MDSSACDPYRLRALIQDHLDGVLDEPGRRALEAALNGDQQARRIYVEQLRLEGALRLMRPAGEGRRLAGRWQRVAGLVATAAGLLFGLVLWQGWRQPQPAAYEDGDLAAQPEVADPVSPAAEPLAERPVGRSVVLRVARADEPQTVVSALRPGHTIARIGSQRDHRYDDLDPAMAYAIRVLPLRR